MIAGGSVALGAPLAGLLTTFFGMSRGYAVLNEAGVSDPRSLAEIIGHTLMAATSGLFVGGLGLVVFIVGLIFWLAARSASTPPPIPVDGPQS